MSSRGGTAGLQLEHRHRLLSMPNVQGMACSHIEAARGSLMDPQCWVDRGRKEQAAFKSQHFTTLYPTGI